MRTLGTVSGMQMSLLAHSSPLVTGPQLPQSPGPAGRKKP